MSIIEDIQKSAFVTSIQKAVGVISPIYDQIKTVLGLFQPDSNEVFQENVLQAFKDVVIQVNYISPKKFFCGLIRNFLICNVHFKEFVFKR